MILLLRKIKKATALAFVLGVFLFTACQKEESEYIDTTDEDTVTANAIITNLLSRTSQNEGSWDDVIDGVSCGAIQFPVTVIVNGQEITLQNQDDIQLVLAVLNQFPDDVDTVQLVFPVTFILWDYSTVTISNQSELDNLINECVTNVQGNNEITCIELVFPITIFTYNIQQEQTGTVVIDDYQELFIFVQNLDQNDLYSIDFPISVIVNGETIQVTGTQQLQSLIEDCVANSDDTYIDQTQFENDLTTGNWYVTYYFNDYDETDNFNGYQFTFSTNGTAMATNGSNTVNGEWEYNDEYSVPELELDFGNDNPFDDLDEDWEIIEANAEIIKLRYHDDNGSIDYLTFERNPNTSGSNQDLNYLIQYLTTDSWFVTLFEDEGDNETCYYAEYEFIFNINGTVQAQSTITTVTGYWTAQEDSGTLNVILNFDYSNDTNFEDLNDDWDVLLSSNTAINLQDVSGGGGGTDLLNFERNPYTGCSSGGTTAQDVRDILEDGQWYVASYIDEGVDETSDFNDYVFTFNTGGSATASNGSTTQYGTWSVSETSGNIEVVLDFGSSSPLESLTEDWDVMEALINKVTLQHVSGGGTNDLIFEKL